MATSAPTCDKACCHQPYRLLNRGTNSSRDRTGYNCPQGMYLSCMWGFGMEGYATFLATCIISKLTGPSGNRASPCQNPEAGEQCSGERHLSAACGMRILHIFSSRAHVVLGVKHAASEMTVLSSLSKSTAEEACPLLWCKLQQKPEMSRTAGGWHLKFSSRPPSQRTGIPVHQCMNGRS